MTILPNMKQVRHKHYVSVLSRFKKDLSPQLIYREKTLHTIWEVDGQSISESVYDRDSKTYTYHLLEDIVNEQATV